MNRILIAEDETRIASFVEEGLRANGFSTTLVEDGEDALRLARTGEFDLLVLDLGLPGKDGLDVLRELRHEGRPIPVVILTARDSVAEIVAGLDRGADDYMTKPFRFDELLARIRARLPRNAGVTPKLLVAGAIALDLRTQQAVVGGRVVELSPREFALAEVLFHHPGQTLTRQQLVRHVWGQGLDPGSNVLDVYVGYLRRKLGSDRITSVRGTGYRLEVS